MAFEDHTAALVHFAAGRRCVAGPRGAVVRLCRFQAPMAGRAHSSALPPLRNRNDVRRWAWEAGSAAMPNAVDQFVRAVDQLWREFAGTVSEARRAAALAMVDLDADQHRASERLAVVMAWANAFGDRAVTAAQLCGDRACREAIGLAMVAAADVGRNPEEVTPSRASWFVSGLIGLDLGAWRVQPGTPDRHSKVKRWRLVKAAEADRLAAPTT
jgi:hypothetical protein